MSESTSRSLSESINVSVLRGRLSSEPRLRDLPSGSTLCNLEVTVDHADRRADSVPVACFDPTDAVTRLVEGDEVVVLGAVRRRFFRAGGATVSRTELVADSITKTTRRASVRRVLQRAADALGPVPES